MIKVLVVDDDNDIASQIKYFSLEEGYNVYTSSTAESAVELIKEHKPEIIIVDYDLPGMTGLELIRLAKEIDETIKAIMVSGKITGQYIKTESKDLGVIEFIPKPFKMKHLKEYTFPLIQKQQFKREKLMLDTIKDLELKSLQVAINALESKDKYTDGHSKRVKTIAIGIAKKLNKNVREINIEYKDVEWSALLHDIGKIGIREKILNKSGILTDKEFEEIKKHPSESAKILNPLRKYFNNCIEAIKHHHERLDGSGYPDGLKGEEIPLISKILSVADSFDAITSGRTYKHKVNNADAIAELIKCKNSQFDPVIVDAFIDYLSETTSMQETDKNILSESFLDISSCIIYDV